LKVIHSVHPQDFRLYDTQMIRERFLLGNLVAANQLNLAYTHYDRLIAGVANPVDAPIILPNYPNLRADYFLERREMGIINVAGNGFIVADGQQYNVNKLDCLYLGKGVKEVSFQSVDQANPAVFYILSAPAHVAYAITIMSHEAASKVNAGTTDMANVRIINKYIHKEGIQSCQLVMGLTILQNGSVWNTMPAHVHDRRTEAYFYFDLAEGQRIFHLMGEAKETRHILIDNYEAVISPPWSIHSGAGTGSYSFIWGMGGENLDYTDMDAIKIEDIR
jgi:4-deoxy-L-threo-5-hexosulose-uronate ketol-isomerase